MQLGIYSLDKVLFRGDAREVNCPAKDGEITILDHHEPFITLLKGGVLKVIERSGEEKYIQINGGFLEVQKDSKVKILVEQ